MDNGIETPDDVSMEINPRDVLQVGGSSGSSVPSVNREVPEIIILDDEDGNEMISDDNVPQGTSVIQVNGKKYKGLSDEVFRDIKLTIDKYFDQLMTKLRKKEAEVDALQLKNQKLQIRLRKKQEKNLQLSRRVLELTWGEESLQKAEELGEHRKGLERGTTELKTVNELYREIIEEKKNQTKVIKEPDRLAEYRKFWIRETNKWKREIEAENKLILDYMENHFKCYFCYKMLKDAVIVECGHMFCRSCVSQRLQNGRETQCPTCGKKIESLYKRAYLLAEESAKKKRKPMLLENATEKSKDA